MGDFFSDNFFLFSVLFGIKGFYFCVKGKIGLSGNAKKKFFFFKKGSLKISSKYSKIDNGRFFIKTNCGSLGINTILSY
jgi:ribosomal protein S3